VPRLIVGRILGGELPPRDTPGARLAGLRQLLTRYEHGYITRDERFWVVNRVIDPELQAAYVETLQAAGESYVAIPFDPAAYAAATTRDEKIVAAIGINQARNELIDDGLARGDYVLALDGDCYFTEAEYAAVIATLADYTLPYFSLRTLRTAADDPTRVLEVAEPMAAFSARGTMRFDETLPFGRGPKLDLLYRLGHSRKNPHIALDHEKYTRVIGTVRHAATGDEQVDIDTALRQDVRRKAVDALLARLDAQLDVAK
jgi:hypothetical protein